MTLGKLKKTILVLLLIVLGAGGGTLIWHSQAADRGRAAQPVQRKQKDETSMVARFVEQLRRNPVRRLPGDDQLGLFLMDLQTRDVHLIVAQVDQERAYCGTPCWSNDGRRILFDASPGQKWDKTRLQMLEVIDQRLRLSSLGPGNCPTVSPDGKHIAYLVNPGADLNTPSGIHVMKADSSDRRRLGGYGIPKWSPDGQHLLMVSFTNPCNLTLLNVATEEKRPLRFAGHEVYSIPSWAGEGLLAAVVRSANGFAIALVDITNPYQVRVKETLWKRGEGTNVEPLCPVYSPHTGRVIFVGREQQGQALYSFQRGQTPRRLEQGAHDGKILSLALSPDGRYLLFCSDRP